MVKIDLCNSTLDAAKKMQIGQCKISRALIFIRTYDHAVLLLDKY